VPPQASIDDIVLPSNSVYWRDGLFGTSGSWEVEDFFPTLVLNNEIDSATIMKLKNQTISLFLPVQYQDKSLYYTFRFMVTEVTDITATSIKPVNKVVPNNPKNKNKKK